MLIGATHGHLGQSLYLRELHNREDGGVPPTDLTTEKHNGDFVRSHILNGTVTACHDVSDGGLIVALAEMAMAGRIGAEINHAVSNLAAFWYGEDQSRYVVTTTNPDAIIAAANIAGIPVTRLGATGGTDLKINGESVAVTDLIDVNEAWLPSYMGA